jgi:nicotinamide-nucleotide adenylyltransferase
MRALLIGRFQPLHLGHMEIIRKAISEYELIIGIWSAQKSHTVENPFTAGERYEMIQRALKDEGIDAIIIPIPDVDYNSVWASHVISLCPPFDVVLSNNPLTIELFSPFKKVIGTELFSREEYSGRKIRKRMIEGEEWKNLVPKTVADYIDEIKGVERLRYLEKGDE